MRGTKPSLATCATFCESLTPSNRRTATYMALAYLLHIEGGPRRPCRVDQRAQCERLQGLAQLLKITIPRTPVNKPASMRQTPPGGIILMASTRLRNGSRQGGGSSYVKGRREQGSGPPFYGGTRQGGPQRHRRDDGSQLHQPRLLSQPTARTRRLEAADRRDCCHLFQPQALH